MHEMAIAEELIRQVLEVAERASAVAVDEVDVDCGLMRGIVPEALDAAFAALAQGTLAQGAVLRQRERPIVALCNACGVRFEARVDWYQCPTCREADVEVVEGDDIILAAVACRTPGERS